MTATRLIGNCEATLSLTPGGLGRLTAVLGGRADDNPYPGGTPQHTDWQESFSDVLALQQVDFLNQREPRLHAHALNA